MNIFLTGLFLNILYQGIDDYIEFYNTHRPHSKIQYKTPEQKEREYAVTFGMIEIE